MKIGLSSIFFILPFFLFVSTKTNSQWLDRGEYKELQPSTTSIKQLIVPKSDNFFYVIDSNLVYRQIDYTGKEVFQRQINQKIEDYTYRNCSLDGQTLFYILRDKNTRAEFKIRLISALDGALIKEYTDTVETVPGSNNQQFIYTLDYNTKLNKFLCIYNSSGETHSGNLDRAKFIGYSYLIKNDTNKIFLGSGYTSFSINDENMDRHIIMSYNYYMNAPIMTDPIVEWCYVYFKDFNFSRSKFDRINVDNYGTFPPSSILYKTFYRLANSSDKYLMIKDSVLSFMDSSGDSTILTEKIKLNYKPNDIAFSSIDKYLVTITPDYSIEIWDATNKSKVKAYTAPDKYPIIDLKISDKYNGFFVRNNNTIRYYGLDFLSDYIEPINDQYQYSIVPNPVSDFLTIIFPNSIIFALPTKLEIFSVLGTRILSLDLDSNEKLNLKVSNFESGLYFLKIGNKVSKFVKI